MCRQVLSDSNITKPPQHGKDVDSHIRHFCNSNNLWNCRDLDRTEARKSKPCIEMVVLLQYRPIMGILGVACDRLSQHNYMDTVSGIRIVFLQLVHRVDHFGVVCISIDNHVLFRINN